VRDSAAASVASGTRRISWTKDIRLQPRPGALSFQPTQAVTAQILGPASGRQPSACRKQTASRREKISIHRVQASHQLEITVDSAAAGDLSDTALSAQSLCRFRRMSPSRRFPARPERRLSRVDAKPVHGGMLFFSRLDAVCFGTALAAGRWPDPISAPSPPALAEAEARAGVEAVYFSNN